jgi:hypothetical protein
MKAFDKDSRQQVRRFLIRAGGSILGLALLLTLTGCGTYAGVGYVGEPYSYYSDPYYGYYDYGVPYTGFYGYYGPYWGGYPYHRHFDHDFRGREFAHHSVGGFRGDGLRGGRI